MAYILAILDRAVEHMQHGVDIFHRLVLDIRHDLDTVRRSLDLIVRELQTQLLRAALHSVPAREARANMHVAIHTKVLGRDNLVRFRLGQNSLGVDTSLVRERAVSSDRVVEGNLHLHSISHKIFDVTERLEVVLAHDILTVGCVHTSDKATQTWDTISLTDTQHGSVNMRSTSFESRVCVSDGTTRVVVEVALNITAHYTTERAHQVVHLARVRHTDRVGNAHTVHADLVDDLVDAQQIHQVRTERVFRRETDLNTLALHEANDLDSRLGDVCHILTV